MLKVFYTLFLFICMTSLAGGNGVEIIRVCGYCEQYNPPHWQEDGFPPITMIDLGDL